MSIPFAIVTSNADSCLGKIYIPRIRTSGKRIRIVHAKALAPCDIFYTDTVFEFITKVYMLNMIGDF